MKTNQVWVTIETSDAGGSHGDVTCRASDNGGNRVDILKYAVVTPGGGMMVMKILNNYYCDCSQAQLNSQPFIFYSGMLCWTEVIGVLPSMH